MSEHPWGEFLRARVAVIEWLASMDGGSHTDAEIAATLSMEPVQVKVIRSAMKKGPHEAGPEFES